MNSAALARTARAASPSSAPSEISLKHTLAFGVPAIAMTGPALFIQFYA